MRRKSNHKQEYEYASLLLPREGRTDTEYKKFCQQKLQVLVWDGVSFSSNPWLKKNEPSAELIVHIGYSSKETLDNMVMSGWKIRGERGENK